MAVVRHDKCLHSLIFVKEKVHSYILFFFKFEIKKMKVKVTEFLQSQLFFLMAFIYL